MTRCQKACCRNTHRISNCVDICKSAKLATSQLKEITSLETPNLHFVKGKSRGKHKKESTSQGKKGLAKAGTCVYCGMVYPKKEDNAKPLGTSARLAESKPF